MDQYKKFKNYLHNDIKITKEDIKIIIKNTINEEICKLIKDDIIINRMINDCIKTTLSGSTRDLTMSMREYIFLEAHKKLNSKLKIEINAKILDENI
jgi:hypothetical protein